VISSMDQQILPILDSIVLQLVAQEGKPNSAAIFKEPLLIYPLANQMKITREMRPTMEMGSTMATGSTMAMG